MKLDFIDKPINPPGPYRFTVVSTFAGCGGSSLGYKWAGGKVLAAIEWDQNAVDTYRLNHQGTPVLHRDIASVTVDELLALTGLEVGELDILDGSPPCQGFSTAGKRQMDDDRNQLFREYARLLAGLRPRVFIMENVSGMVKGKMRVLFVEILKELKAQGYRVSARLLNAAYFGVPQTRERMIFIGVHNDLNIEPSHPSAKTRPIALRDAFACLPDNRSEVYEYPDWLKLAVKDIKRRETTGDRTKATAFRKYKGTSGSAMNYVRLAWDQPSTTVCKSFISQAWLGHPDDERFINEVELKRIASYPDAFEFVGTFKQKVERIGNSVPPRFMQAIAEHVYANILSKTGSAPVLVEPAAHSAHLDGAA